MIKQLKKLNSLPRKSLLKIFIYFSMAIFLIVSILSFNAADSSMNLVSSKHLDTSNFAGNLGAFVADFLMQFFGFASLLIPIFLISNGVILFNKNNNFMNHLLRIIIFCLSFMATCMIFAIIPVNSESFIEYGGIIGSIILDKFTNLQILENNFTHYFVILISIFTFFGILFSLNIKLIKIPFHRLNISKPNFHGKKSTSVKRKRKTNPDSRSDTKVIQANEEYEFTLPSIDLLNEIKNTNKPHEVSKNVLAENSDNLQKVLQDFGVKGKIVNVHPGPVVTLYEIEPAAGTKSSRVISLADDIARSMSSTSARIAVLPGKNALGAELPNKNRQIIYLRSILESQSYKKNQHKLPIILGKNISNEDIIVDLAKMPHLLVAGTTGSGKSVAVNTMILSLLMKLTPDQCKFIMIDPKMLELSVYDGIPHLLAPVVTEPGKAVVALKWVVKEMENRYRLMSNIGVRNIDGYNKSIKMAVESGQVLEKTVQTGFDPETGKPTFEKLPLEMEELPYIVVIVDEMADLMIVAGKDIESSIQRLAQMARAAGIHIIMATQRPSVDVITGVIKANFPTRISFQVTSKIDSRTIIGEQGAEQLLGMGDMLYLGGGSRLSRVHGPFVDDREVEKIVTFLKSQSSPSYKSEITEETEEDPNSEQQSPELNKDASLYDQAVAIILRDKKVSTSYVQRSLRIGYNRAADIIDKMEQEGIISKPNHAGKREILVPTED